MAQINLALPRFPERAIRYSDARKILLKNMSAECDLATCFIGPPGIGKTALVEEVAQEIKAHLCVIPLSCYDASELKGIPRVVSWTTCARCIHPVKENTSGYVTYYAHNFEFPATDDPDLWIFFFDEFNTVRPPRRCPYSKRLKSDASPGHTSSPRTTGLFWRVTPQGLGSGATHSQPHYFARQPARDCVRQQRMARLGQAHPRRHPRFHQ